MATLPIKGMDNSLYAQIREMAAAENRSVSEQVLVMAKEYLARRKGMLKTRSAAAVLLDLSGSWDDSRSADEIIRDLKKARKYSYITRGGCNALTPVREQPLARMETYPYLNLKIRTSLHRNRHAMSHNAPWKGLESYAAVSAPARGATASYPTQDASGQRFNPRPRAGGDC